MPETKRLILKHPEFDDWKSIYRNLWQHEESAKYMLWSVTTSEDEAKKRMERTIAFQQTHTAWLIYEKESGEAIGFAGFLECKSGIFEDTGVAFGPKYVGKGYGKETLKLLMELAKEAGGQKFIATCRSENTASRHLILGQGFQFTHTEDRIDPRNDMPYVLEFYEKEL